MKRILIIFCVLIFSLLSFAEEDTLEIKKEIKGINKEIYDDGSKITPVQNELGDVEFEKLGSGIGESSEKDKLKDMKLVGDELSDVGVDVEDNLNEDIATDLNDPKARSWWKYILIGIAIVAGASAL